MPRQKEKGRPPERTRFCPGVRPFIIGGRMSISQRRDGRWMVKYKPHGERAWRQKTFVDEQTARAWEAEFLAESTAEEERLTLGEVVMLYYRSHPESHPRTERNVVYFLAGHDADGKHVPGVGEFLRDKFADALTRQDLERMREGFRSRGTGNNTINKYQAYLHAILAWAVDQELISRNPWRDYKRLRVQRHLCMTTLEDFRRVYAFLPAHLQWAFKTAFALALRPGQVELFSLTWDAFDWRRSFVHVRQGKTGLIKTVIPPAMYMEEAARRYAVDRGAGIHLVCHRHGRRIISYKDAWASACKKAGVKMRPYDVRHLSASEMLARGADLASVAAQMGHSSVTTTGNTYAHVTAGGQARAAALMPVLDAEKVLF